MRTVALVLPPVQARFPGAPLGLLYLAQSLRLCGHRVELFDLQATARALSHEAVATIVALQPDVVGISVTSPAAKAADELATALRAELREAWIVRGGPHETYAGAETLAHSVATDFVLAGDADHAFPALIGEIYGARRFSTIPGLFYRSGSSVERAALPAPALHMDEVPDPAYDLLHDYPYYNFPVFGGRKTWQVQTSRGCPFACTFCNQRNRTSRPSANSRVMALLEQLGSSPDPASFFFDDATFTVRQKSTTDLAQLIVARAKDWTFGCQTRSELVSGPLLELLASAGFQYISFGLETVDESTLRRYMKTRSIHGHLHATDFAVRTCRALGIPSALNLIVGFPNESDDHIKRTFEFAARLSPTFVSLSALALYPHEDRSTIAAYRDGVSTEEVWAHYDEGWGSVHPYLCSDRAAEILEIARSALGPERIL